MLPTTLLHAATQKVAGMEIGISGYHEDPSVPADQIADADARAKKWKALQAQHAGPSPQLSAFQKKPGFFGRMIGRKPTTDMAGFQNALSGYRQKTEALPANIRAQNPGFIDGQHFADMQREKIRVGQFSGGKGLANYLAENVPDLPDDIFADGGPAAIPAAKVRQILSTAKDEDLQQHGVNPQELRNFLKNKKSKFFRFEAQ